MTNLQKKKKAILDKYFPDMGVCECDFDIDTGKCKKCGVFFADKKFRLCPVMSDEEITIDGDDNQWD